MLAETKKSASKTPKMRTLTSHERTLLNDLKKSKERDPFDLGDHLRLNKDRGLTTKQISKQSGYSVASVQRFLWLSKWPTEARKIVRAKRNVLTVNVLVQHFASRRKLYGDLATITPALHRFLAGEKLQPPPEEEKTSRVIFEEMVRETVARRNSDLLRERFGTKIEVRVSDPVKQYGVISLHFFGEEDRERLMEILLR